MLWFKAHQMLSRLKCKIFPMLWTIINIGFFGLSGSSESPSLPSRSSSTGCCPSGSHRDSGSDTENFLCADPGYDGIFRKVTFTLKKIAEMFRNRNVGFIWWREDAGEKHLKAKIRKNKVKHDLIKRNVLNSVLKSPVLNLFVQPNYGWRWTPGMHCAFPRSYCHRVLQYRWNRCFVSWCFARNFFRSLGLRCQISTKHLFKSAALWCCCRAGSCGPRCHCAHVESLESDSL